MKSLIKIFIYISWVIWAIASIIILFSGLSILFLGFIWNTSGTIDELYNLLLAILFFVLAIFFIAIPFTVGKITIRKLNEGKSKNELLSISIICLICCSFIAGLLMIIATEEELEIVSKQSSQIYNDDFQFSNFRKNLIKLQNMKEEGLINKDEFESLKQKVIYKEINHEE